MLFSSSLSFVFVEMLAVAYKTCNYNCSITLSDVLKHELLAYVHSHFNCVLAVLNWYLGSVYCSVLRPCAQGFAALCKLLIGLVFLLLTHTAQNELLSEFLQNDMRYCWKKSLEDSSIK